MERKGLSLLLFPLVGSGVQARGQSDLLVRPRSGSAQRGTELATSGTHPDLSFTRTGVTSSGSDEPSWLQFRKHAPCLKLNRFVHTGAWRCLPCVLPFSAALACTWQFWSRIQKPILFTWMNGIHENCGFCWMFSPNDKLLKIPPNTSIYQKSPACYTLRGMVFPAPQFPSWFSLDGSCLLLFASSPGESQWAQPPLWRAIQPFPCLIVILFHPHLPKNPLETKSSPVSMTSPP